MQQKKREIVFFETYFIDFYNNQTLNTQRKIEYVLNLVKVMNVLPIKFFKRITNENGLFEIRVKAMEKNIRIFCLQTEFNEILLLNSFIKKTQKTPKKELQMARKLQSKALLK